MGFFISDYPGQTIDMPFQRIDESLAKGLADCNATAIEIEREKFERSIDKRRLFQISNRMTWYGAVPDLCKAVAHAKRIVAIRATQ